MKASHHRGTETAGQTAGEEKADLSHVALCPRSLKKFLKSLVSVASSSTTIAGEFRASSLIEEPRTYPKLVDHHESIVEVLLRELCPLLRKPKRPCCECSHGSAVKQFNRNTYPGSRRERHRRLFHRHMHLLSGLSSMPAAGRSIWQNLTSNRFLMNCSWRSSGPAC